MPSNYSEIQTNRADDKNKTQSKFTAVSLNITRKSLRGIVEIFNLFKWAWPVIAILTILCLETTVECRQYEADHHHHQQHHHQQKQQHQKQLSTSAQYVHVNKHNTNNNNNNNERNNNEPHYMGHYYEQTHAHDNNRNQRRNGERAENNDDRHQQADDDYQSKRNNHKKNRGHRKKHHKHKRRQQRRQQQQRQYGYVEDGGDNDISLWISEQQLKMLSALFFPQVYSQGRLYAIDNGHVLNDVRDANLYKYLTIPSEVNYVNFTWKSGNRKYFYHFDRLETLDDSILKAPTVSIKTKGRIPQEEKSFSILLPCNGNSSGTGMFNVGLSIENRRGKPLNGTPLRLNFKKECAHRGVYDNLDASNSTLTTAQGPDPECNARCGNNGFCNLNKICQCKAGYTGEYCQTPFCFPACLNGGNCTAPHTCTCMNGFQGTQCEGGICAEKCLNGGKCIQKDKCQCPKGYYGLRCEYSKCVIPCKNGGRCIGTNICRCPYGLQGDHCEIGRRQHSTCKRPCRHGVCTANKICKCDQGFHGRWCNARNKKRRRNNQR